MAIRERKGRKKPWEVYWNNPFTLKRESLYVETEGEAKKQDALKKYQLRYERDTFRPVDADTSKPQSQTLETAYYAYLKEKRFSKKGLAWQLDSMKKPLEVLGNKPLTEITLQDLQSVKMALTTSNVSQVTVRNRLSVLRTVLRWCHKMEFMETMPRFPDLPPAAYKHIIPPTDSELSRLWEFSPPHIQRVIVLGVMFGVRVGPSEMFKMTWTDFDFDHRLVRVQAAKKNIMEPWREVPIRDNIVPLLMEWRDADMSSGVPCVIHFRSKQVESIQTAWEKSIARSGVRSFSPYSLRHKFATDLLAAGVDPGTVAKLMGHRTTAMIFAHYQHVITEQKRRAVEALPELSCCDQYVAKNMWQKENDLHRLM